MTRGLPLIAPVLFVVFATSAAPTFAQPVEKPREKTKVLIVTGGHGFERKPFFQIFADNPDIEFTKAEQKKTSEAYDRKDLKDYDVIVLYDMVQQITDGQKANVLALLDRGVGLVVLHHAIVSYQSWPEFEQIIGGRYPEPADKKGVSTEALGYEHDVDIPCVIVANGHPVTAGLSDFTIHDEIYWGFRVGRDVTPLVTTTQPKSGKPLAWARKGGKSRVVYVQLGHGPSAFGDANYRQLIRQSIRWTAKGEP
jgi:type 1 glutamine amidotransferase